MNPIILTEGKYSKTDLIKLKENKIWELKDIYLSQIKELFEISNPRLLGTEDYEKELSSFIAERTSPEADLRGNYVYFPWSGLLLHMVLATDLYTLRTNRVSHLVSKEEQQKLSGFTAGIAGLSFGNGIALSLAYSGDSNIIKIADRDIFETTNLNRVRVGLPSVEVAKTTVTAQEIYEINPYADVEVFADGLDEDNLDEFINGDKPLNIIFDVVDDFAMKVRIRLAAKKAGIPVVMLTSLEDSVLVDVERFDLDSSIEIFHGLLGDITDKLLNEKMTEQDKARYAMAIVGRDHVSYRNLFSLSEVGSTLVSRPHLFGTVSIVCGLAAYITKRIALGEDMPSMRNHVKFNEILKTLPNKDDTPKAREELFSKMTNGAER